MKIASEGKKEQYFIIVMLIIGFIITIFFKNTNYIKLKFKTNFIYLLMTITLLFISIINLSKVSEFLYFQF